MLVKNDAPEKWVKVLTEKLRDHKSSSEKEGRRKRQNMRRRSGSSSTSKQSTSSSVVARAPCFILVRADIVAPNTNVPGKLCDYWFLANRTTDLRYCSVQCSMINIEPETIWTIGPEVFFIGSYAVCRLHITETPHHHLTGIVILCSFSGIWLHHDERTSWHHAQKSPAQPTPILSIPLNVQLVTKLRDRKLRDE